MAVAGQAQRFRTSPQDFVHALPELDSVALERWQSLMIQKWFSPDGIMMMSMNKDDLCQLLGRALTPREENIFNMILSGAPGHVSVDAGTLLLIALLCRVEKCHEAPEMEVARSA